MGKWLTIRELAGALPWNPARVRGLLGKPDSRPALRPHLGGGTNPAPDPRYALIRSPLKTVRGPAPNDR